MSASVTGTVVGSTVSGSQGGGLTVGPGNTLTATAVGNNQVLSQTMTAGEQTAAAALLDSTTQQSTTTATLGSSTVGVVAGGTVGGSGITVTGNSAGSTARANDSSASIVASGSNAGVLGTSQTPTLTSFPTAGATLNVQGDVIATGYQVLDTGSNVSASTGPTTGSGVTDVGLVLQSQATTSGLTGGVTVQSNNVNTVAGGSRLGLSLSSALTGGNAGSTAYALQTAADSNITATTSSVNIGVDASAAGASLSSVPVVVSANGITTSATANSVNTAVNADLSLATNALAVGSDQFLSATTQPVTVAAQLGNTDVGLNQATAANGTGVTLSATGNTLATTAIGNQQAQTLSLAGGAVNESAPTISATQTLQAPGGLLNITADNGLVTGLISGATIPSLNKAPVVVGVDNGTLSTGSSVLVSGNTITAEALGNTGSQSLSAFSGAVNTGLDLVQTQTATAEPTEATTITSSNSGTPATGISISSGLANTALGLGPNVAQAGDTTVTVSNNTLESLAQVNQQSQTVGNLTGQVSGTAGGLGITVNQTDSNVGSSAGTSGISLGVAALAPQLNGASDSVLVSGNSVNAIASLNSAAQTLGNVGGGVSSGVGIAASQTVGSTLGPTAAVATVSSVGFGLDGTGANVTAMASATIQADSNAVEASANGNQLTQTIGAISGQVGGTVGGTLNGLSQTTSSSSANATVSNIGLGLIATNGVSASALQTTVDASNNSIEASARQNGLSETNAGFSSTLASGGYVGGFLNQKSTNDLTQTQVSGVSFGLVGAEPIGQIGGGITLTANNNTTRADTAGNLAIVALGGAAGTLGDGFGYTINQSLSMGTQTAFSNGLLFGTSFGGSTFIGATSPVMSLVDDNLAVTLASGNGASLSLGGISGGVLSGAINDTGFSITQSQDDQITATVGKGTELRAASITIGIGENSGSEGGGTVALPVTVSGNSVLTAAQGNSAASDLGTLNANIASDAKVQSKTAQNFGTTVGNVSAAATATTSGVDIGLSVNSIAVSGTVPVTVTGNTVSTTATANSSTASTAVNGSIGGTLSLSEAQAAQLNMGSSGISATSTGIDVGVISSPTLGSGLSAVVSDNTITSGVIGNSATGSISSLATAPLTGQVTLGSTQTVSGTGSTTGPSLSASLQNSIVGLTGKDAIDGSTVIPATVDDNVLQASAIANTATHTIGTVTGTLSGNATSPVLQLTDSQTVTNANASASVSGALVGGLTPNLTATINGNTVSAGVAGNSAADSIASLSTASLAGGVSLSGTQTVAGTATTGGPGLTATLSNVAVGLEGEEAASSGLQPLNVPASIDNNQLLATAVANTSTRSVGNVSGVLSGNTSNTPVLALNDAQTVTNATVSSSITNAAIGAVLSGNGEPPLNISVSNNQVVAQSIANSATQTLSMDGAGVASRAMTSLTANQSTLGTTVTASLSGVNVGISPTSNAITSSLTAVNYSGSAVTAGNTVGATAIGNSSQLTHK